MSSIAHTLLSTQPDGSSSSRSTSSVMSVGTPLVRFGHATHTVPLGVTAAVSVGPLRREGGTFGEEGDDDVETWSDLTLPLGTGRELAQRVGETGWRRSHRETLALGDPELLRERGA